MSKETCLEAAVAAVKQARQYTDDVQFSAEDATRSDLEFLCRVVEAVIAAGCTTVNLPDTVGFAVPHEISAFFTAILTRVPNATRATFSTHCHDDLGLAVANTLAAVTAGARQVECTINGVGERAGNASLEEIVMATRVRADSLPYDTAVNTTRNLSDQPDAERPDRRERAGEQGDRRAQRLRARGGHSPGRHAQGSPHLRDHAAGRRRRAAGDAGPRQALGPPRRSAPLRAARRHARAPGARSGLPCRHRPRRPREDRERPAICRRSSRACAATSSVRQPLSASATTSRRPPPRAATGTGCNGGSGFGIRDSRIRKSRLNTDTDLEPPSPSPEPRAPRYNPTPVNAIHPPSSRRRHRTGSRRRRGDGSAAPSRHGSGTRSTCPRRSSARRRCGATCRRCRTRRWPRRERLTPSCSAPSAIRRSIAAPRQAGRKRRCSASARRSDSTRTCARRGCGRAWRPPGPLKPEVLAGTDMLVVRELTGGLVLRRAARHRGRRQLGAQHHALLAARDRTHRPARVRRRQAAPPARHIGRQGQRARDVTAVADGRDRGRAPSIRTSRSITCWWTAARCASRSRRPASTSS